MESLALGSKCVVYVATSREDVQKSSGVFCGFVPVGEESSMCLILDDAHGELKGKIRLIPTDMIVAIDVIELRSGEGKKENIEGSYYS